MGLPIVDETQMRLGDDAMLATSPVRENVEACEEAAGFSAGLVGAARTALGALADEQELGDEWKTAMPEGGK